MTIPVEISGIVVLSVVITACTIFSLVSNSIKKNLYYYLQEWFSIVGSLSMASNSRIAKS